MSVDQRSKLRVHIRWMIRRDMPEVLDIERESFEFPWFEEDFIRCLRQRNCIGMVAEHAEHVVGFMIYELHKTRLHILNFAVAAGVRHRSVGTQMIEKLVGKLSSQRRTEIIARGPRDEPGRSALFPQVGLPRDERPPRLLRRLAGRRLPDAIQLPDGTCRDDPAAQSDRSANGGVTHFGISTG